MRSMKPVSHAELKTQNPNAPPEAKTWQEIMRDLTGVDFTVCPQCGQGRLYPFPTKQWGNLPWHRRSGIPHDLFHLPF